MEAADLVGFRELKSKLLGVVVDDLNAVELQRDEALVPASKRSFGRLASSQSLCLIFCFLCGVLDACGIVSLVVEIVSCPSKDRGSAGIEKRVRTTFGRFSSISTVLLEERSASID
jgi:hypothetical protein